MSLNPAKAWSEGLKRQTRELIESQGLDFPLIDTKIHMKHIESRYGYIELAKLISGNIIVVDKNSGTETHFNNAEELINAGWAID